VVRPFVWGLLLLAVLLAAVLLFVQSPFAHRRAAALVIARTSEFLGRDIRVGRIDYDFFPLAFELYDVVVPGPGPDDPAVARIPLVRGEFSWRDLRQRVLRLEELQISRPQIYFQFNPDGTNNLPQFRTRQRRGPARVEFQLGRVIVQNGTLRINERRLPLHLQAESIWGRAVGYGDDERGLARLDALVTAQQVVTTLPRAKPYPFTASAKGTLLLRQGRVRLDNALLTGPELKAQAEGVIDWRRENRGMELRIEARGSSTLANRLGYLREPIEGPFHFQGSFTQVKSDWSWTGTATSPRIAILDRVFTEIEADLTGTREAVDVDLERAGYVGGTVRGDIGIDTRGRGEDRRGVPVEALLTFDGLSFQPLIADQFPGEKLPIVSGISGRTSGELEYRFSTEAFLFGTGQIDAQVRGTSETGLPLTGQVPLTLDGGTISSDGIRLTAPGAEILGRDFAYDFESKRGRIGFRLVSQDVDPIGKLLLGPPERGEEPAFWLPARGRGTAEGTAAFSGDDFSIRVALDLRDAVAPALAADTVHGTFTFTRRAVEDLRLEATGGGGALMLTGRVPLPPEGRETATEPLALAIDAADWPLSGLGFFLPAGVTDEIQGDISGRLDLRGFPDRLSGGIEAQVQDLTVAGNPAGQARATVSFDEGRVLVERAVLQTPAGSILARGTFDQPTGALDLTLDAPSLSLAAEPFRTLLNGQLAGQVTVAGAASGTLENPAAMVTVTGRSLALRGRPLGGDRETRLTATLNGEALEVNGSLLGLATFQGGGTLSQEGADVALDVRSDDLGTLARLLSPQPIPDFTGSLLGSLGLEADFSASDYQAELRLADLRLTYEGRTINNLEPVVAELTPGRVTVRSLYLGEEASGTELFATGTVGLGETTPLDLRFQGTLPAVWAELALPDWEVEGSLDVLGAVRGTAANPLVNGQGELTGGQIIIPNFPQAFEDINALLSFNRDRIVLEQLRARLGNGTVLANGNLILPGEGRELSYRVNAAAESINFRFPEGVLNRGDADLALVSTDTGRLLSGRMALERTLYVEDVQIELLQLLQNAFQRERLEVEETNELLATTELNLVVEGLDALRVRNNVANLEGDIDLVVRGTLARPVVFGEIEVDEGTLVFNDNEYEVQRGLLAFSNPNRIDPVIDLVAQTRIQGFDIILNLGGTFEDLDVDFSSDANLADLEIFSLIATGQRPGEEAGRELTAEGEQVGAGQIAQQILAGEAASAVTRRFGTLFGLDRFRINPVSPGVGQPVSGVGITVGKRLSRDIFVTYTSDPDPNRQYIVQVEWQVQRNLLLVLTQEGDDSYAIDLQWQRRF
jgi:hypothetical protein